MMLCYHLKRREIKRLDNELHFQRFYFGCRNQGVLFQKRNTMRLE